MKQVDIIIPVYNGYEDIQLCMESIFRHTDLAVHRVLLINDKSPDERILPLLKGYVGDHVELIDSPENEGFSASVNKGMKSSDTDVILLNSDTIVTKNWVEKLQACAYHDLETGTVTPLSNSATLCSVPVMCQDNPVPDNVTIDEYAEIIERCSLKEYPRITVAVGFCMYIKREVIEITGLFDGKTFERGYGEENDFCNRAEQYGYRHVMCDDTFIYHKGTVSFLTEEKQRLIQEHDRILCQRYPRQMENNHLYCIHNPHQYIRDNINLYTTLKNGRKNILYLIHADFRKDAYDHAGGTQYHVKDLTLGLKNEYNLFVVSRDKSCLRLTIYCGEKMYSFKYVIGSAPLYPVYTNAVLKKLFGQILDAFSVDLVHIHQTSGLSLDMYTCAKERNIPLIATMHDYYYICPTIKLVDLDQKFIGACRGQQDGDSRTEERCRACLMERAGIAVQVDFLKKWRMENEKALSLCDRIVVPSESAKNVVLSYFEGLGDRMQVIPHGSDFGAPEEEIVVDDVRKSDQIRMSVDYIFDFPKSPGTIAGWAYKSGSDNDGVKVLIEISDSDENVKYIEAVKQEREDVRQLTGSYFNLMSGFSASVQRQQFAAGKLNIRILLQEDGIYYWNGETITTNNSAPGAKKGCLRAAFLGGLVPEKGSGIAYDLITKSSSGIHWYIFGTIGDDRLAELEQKNLTKVGTYERDGIYQMLQDYQIDLICILPIWAETFCYTLSEAWMCGIPVLATDIGAVGQRVKETGAGIVVPPDASPEEILEKIDGLSADPEGYARLKEKAQGVPVRSVEEMLQDYRRLYEGQFSGQPRYGSFDPREIFRGFLDTNGGDRYNAGSKQLLQEFSQSRMMNRQLQDSEEAMMETIHTLRKQMEEFQSSKTYKTVNTAARAVKSVKKVLGKAKRTSKE